MREALQSDTERSNTLTAKIKVIILLLRKAIGKMQLCSSDDIVGHQETLGLLLSHLKNVCFIKALQQADIYLISKTELLS